jgi:hypothetical protein
MKRSVFFHLQSWRTGGRNRSFIGEVVPVGGGRSGERVQESEECKYCVNMNLNGKIRPVEVIQQEEGG